MIRSLRKAYGRASALAVFASLLALGSCEPAGPVVVGAATSPPFVDAARLAIEDELAETPIPGLDTLFIGEGGNLASPAISAADRLVARDGIVGVVGHSNSAASLAAAPIYNAREVVQISPTSTAVIYSEAGAYSFRLAPPDDRQGPFIASALTELLPDGGGVAVLYVNDDYGRGLRRAFVEALDGSAFRILLQLPHNEAEIVERDIEQAERSLEQAQPDALVWLGRGLILNRFLPAIRNALPTAPIVGSDGVYSIVRQDGREALRRGIRFVGFVDLEATEPLRRFAARYSERFGRPATGPDALTYDATRLLLAGIRTGVRTGPALQRYLRSLGRERPVYEGITGPISFDENGDVERSYVMLRYDVGAS